MEFMGTRMLLPGQNIVLKIKVLGMSATEFQDERNGMTHVMTPVPLFLCPELFTKCTRTHTYRGRRF
jgi:hypothetical protein